MSYSRSHKERLSLLLVFALLLVLAMLIAVAWDEHAGGFSLPSMDEEHEDLKEWVETARASDYQNSRNPKDPPARKASQDVHAMYADNLMDMEMSVPPSFDINSPIWWDFDAPDWWDNPAGEYGTRPYQFPWEPGGGGGAAWRVCDSSMWYIECGTCKDWNINQPSSDIIKDLTFSGQGNAWLSDPNDTIEVCAFAGAEDGQRLVVSYTGIPVAGGKKLPSYTCEKTFIIQCGDCECVDAIPPLYVDSTTINRLGSGDNDVAMYVGSSLACGPFTWSVSGTGFAFDSVGGSTTGETKNELDIITLYADATACGTATVTVTDSCGETDTVYILGQQASSYQRIITQFCGLGVDGTDGCICYYPGPSEFTNEYDPNLKWLSRRWPDKYRVDQYTYWQCSSAANPCGSVYWDSHCVPPHADLEEPCITDDAEYQVGCVNQGAGAARYWKYYVYVDEWKCN